MLLRDKRAIPATFRMDISPLTWEYVASVEIGKIHEAPESRPPSNGGLDKIFQYGKMVIRSIYVVCGIVELQYIVLSELLD